MKTWHTYNQALVQRDSLTMWIPETWLSGWNAPQTVNQGAPFKYSDTTVVMILRTVFRLPVLGYGRTDEVYLALMGNQSIRRYLGEGEECRAGEKDSGAGE